MRLTPELRARIQAARDEHARSYGSKGRKQTSSVNDLGLLVALGKLSADEREAWVDRVLLNCTLDEIGNRMESEHPTSKGHLTRQRIQQLEKRAWDKLLLLLGEDFINRWVDKDELDKMRRRAPV